MSSDTPPTRCSAESPERGDEPAEEVDNQSVMFFPVCCVNCLSFQIDCFLWFEKPNVMVSMLIKCVIYKLKKFY